MNAEEEAERRWPSPNTALYDGLRIGFRLGAEWAAEQAESEPDITPGSEEDLIRRESAVGCPCGGALNHKWGCFATEQTRAVHNMNVTRSIGYRPPGM